jgi:hypothetical protein
MALQRAAVADESAAASEKIMSTATTAAPASDARLTARAISPRSLSDVSMIRKRSFSTGLLSRSAA